MSEMTKPIQASEVPSEPPPACPGCGEPMTFYGGSGGFICHDFKILVRPGGWFDDAGDHVKDRRLVLQTVRGICRRGAGAS